MVLKPVGIEDDGSFVGRAADWLTDTYASRSYAPVRVLDYATGDGSADDTTALQTAINDAANSGRAVEIKGRIRITAPLVLPTNKPVTIRAAVTDYNPFDALSSGKASIESSGSSVFVSADSSSVVLDLSGINFRNTNGGITTSLFDTINFESSRIEKITTANYNYIFKAGTLGPVSRVSGSRFMSVKTAFSSADIADSMITENYISGSAPSNASCFIGGWSTSVFSNNYVDFFKRVFDFVSGKSRTDIRVIGNVFDYCWRVFGSSDGTFLTSLVITGNTFMHMKSSVALPFFTSADTDMTTRPWGGLESVAGINRTSILGNHFHDVDHAISIKGGAITEVQVDNIYYSDTTTRVTYEHAYFGGAAEGRKVYIRDLEDKRYTGSLPPATITGATNGSYDLMRAFLNGVPVYNDAGTWRYYTGVAV